MPGEAGEIRVEAADRFGRVQSARVEATDRSGYSTRISSTKSQAGSPAPGCQSGRGP